MLCFVLLFPPGDVPLWDSSQTCQWGFLVFGNFSFMTPSLGRVSVPNSFVSLFVFYILSYLVLKRMGCLSGCLVFSASIQTLFCESCSAFKWSFDEFVGETVVSPSCSSAIFRRWKLTPHTSLSCYNVDCLLTCCQKEQYENSWETENDFTVE